MYIKEIQIQNYGPLDNINLNLESDTSSNPILPLIFVGKNGSGKTLLLSCIVDSLIELKRHKYPILQEVEKDQYFKIGKKDYIKHPQYYSYINIEFKGQDTTGYYTELTTNLSHKLFTSEYSLIPFQNFDINDNTFKEYGFYKKTSQINEIGDILQKNVFLYFPPTRYEKPAWLGERAKVDFQFSEKFVGVSDRNIIKDNVLKGVEAWILNLILDREIYEKRFDKMVTNTGIDVDVFTGHYSGKNEDILKLINQLLTIVYKVKYKNIEYTRIGVSEKNRRNIGIVIKNQNEQDEVMISPSFSHLSSGEIMLFALFCSILKEYDDINNNPIYDTSEISGIVLIDEIDLHLHIEFQKEILPLLLKFFPKIQFIITTHSPFFILGLEEIYNNQIRLIDLPIGNEINITDFSEFQKGYDVFIQKNEQFKVLYNKINLELSNLKKPRIITEGKTDWKHLKKALLRLKNECKFEQLDIEFLEYEDEIQMGDSTLLEMCKHFSKTLHDRKVIFIFDRDTEKIIKEVEKDTGVKNWGNNVFSFCIPIPSHREKYTNISIEFYYKDDDIKTKDELGKRLYFSNEIDITMNKSATNNKSVKESIIALTSPKSDEEFEKKIYDNNVDKIKDENGNLVALSKSNFADKIYKDQDGFAEFDISEFDKIFEIIQEILQLSI